MRPPRITQRLAHQPGEFGHRGGQLLAGRGEQVGTQQFVGRPVRQLDPALRIQPDHACRDAGQHCFGEPPAVIDLLVGIHQLGPLRPKLAGHPVERARQPGDFVLGGGFGHAHGQVATAHPLGCLDQPPDRPGDLIGHQQPDQHGSGQHQKRDQREDRRRKRSAATIGSRPGACTRPPLAQCAACSGGSADRPGGRSLTAGAASNSSCTTARTRVPSRRVHHHHVAAARLHVGPARRRLTPSPPSSPAEATTWPVIGS